MSIDTQPAAQATEALIHQYGRLVFQVIYGLTGEWHESQDLTQDTFLTAFKDTKPYDAGQGWSVLVTEKQGLMSAVSLRIQTKIRKRGLHVGVCRVRALIRAPLPQAWEFLINPEHMHLWGPLTQPVTGIDRPLQAGDRVTQYRKDFFRHYSQALLVEKVVPFRSLHVRDLSPGVVRINATASISVEEATDREATWIEEAIFYSLGKSRPMRWLDRALINPFCNS